MFNLKSLFRKGITAAGAWLGNTIAGPTGGKIGGELAGSLFDKKIGVDPKSVTTLSKQITKDQTKVDWDAVSKQPLYYRNAIAKGKRKPPTKKIIRKGKRREEKRDA